MTGLHKLHYNFYDKKKHKYIVYRLLHTDNKDLVTLAIKRFHTSVVALSPLLCVSGVVAIDDTGCVPPRLFFRLIGFTGNGSVSAEPCRLRTPEL